MLPGGHVDTVPTEARDTFGADDVVLARAAWERDKQQTKKTEPVLIIGAGPAGLAAAAELRRLGVPAQVIERSHVVAPSWRARYDRLRLNTCRWNSRLRPEDRFEAGVPFFPMRDHAVHYLESFAARHDLKVRFGVQVDRIDPCPDGWLLSTTAEPLIARQVIVAIGHQHTPGSRPGPDGNSFPGASCTPLNIATRKSSVIATFWSSAAAARVWTSLATWRRAARAASGSRCGRSPTCS